MKRKIMPKRRQREGKTHYKHRLKVLKGKTPRLVVRRSEQHVWAQVVEYTPDGDKVIAAAHTRELKKYGWNAATSNIPAAYLCGCLVAKKALKKAKRAVVDFGLQKVTRAGVLFAVVKGAVDAGLDIPHAADALPDAKRIRGEHIVAFSGTPGFKGYKHDVDPKKVPELLVGVEAKIKEAQI